MDDERISRLVSIVNDSEKEGKTHSYSHFNIRTCSPDFYAIIAEEEDYGSDILRLPEMLAVLNLHGWRPVNIMPDTKYMAVVLLERPL